MKLVIVDMGCGNMGAVAIAFERLGLTPLITSDSATIAAADKIVLPGVGAAGYAMQQLHARNLAALIPALRQPVLGICLGMQLLFERSEEADVACLGIIGGMVRKMHPPGLPVPHMGWARLEVSAKDIGLLSGDYVYFAHSFACDHGPHTIATVDYGGIIPAIVRKDNFTGVQFHPERSSLAGADFLESFASQ